MIDMISIQITKAMFPKEHSLVPKNGFGSSGPEKLPKIVNCATINETEKLKEKMVRVQVE